MKELRLPSTLKVIGESAFASSLNLEEIVIPDGVEEIGLSAFDGCNNVRSIVIPAGCRIGVNAFKQNAITRTKDDTTTTPFTNLESIEIKGKVTLAGQAIFWGCTKVNRIVYNSLEAPEIENVINTYNAWSSTTASYSLGYENKDNGTNMFYVPAGATYSESDIDLNKAMLFSADGGGFTLSKSL